MFVGPGKMITKGDDIFGADLVAIKEDDRVAFIQCTLDKHITKRKEEFDKYRFNFIFVYSDKTLAKACRNCHCEN